MIKYARFKAEQDSVPIASIVPFCLQCYTQAKWRLWQRTETGYDTEGYGKIYAGNIMIGAHPKQGNSGADRNERHGHQILKEVQQS